jgi:hypothetical protein
MTEVKNLSRQPSLNSCIISLISNERFLRSVFQDGDDSTALVARYALFTPGGEKAVRKSIEILENLDHVPAFMTQEQLLALKEKIRLTLQ